MRENIHLVFHCAEHWKYAYVEHLGHFFRCDSLQVTIKYHVYVLFELRLYQCQSDVWVVQPGV